MTINIQKSMQFAKPVLKPNEENIPENTESSNDKKTNNLLPSGNIQIINEQINSSKKQLKEKINQYETLCAKLGIKPNTSLLNQCKKDLYYYTPNMDNESKLRFLKGILEKLNNDISQVSTEINNIVIEQKNKQQRSIQFSYRFQPNNNF